MSDARCVVIGGGLVGSAIAYGVMRAGESVTVIDEGDIAYRASRGNFGLIWVQGKGDGMPPYAAWTRESAQAWPRLAGELAQAGGGDVGLQQPGGFWFGFSDDELERREITLRPLAEQAGVPFSMCTASQMRADIPALGPKVAGGSYCPLDGHVNPLKLLRALHTVLAAGGVPVRAAGTVTRIERQAGRFVVHAGDARIVAERVVLAAGLGNRALGGMVGLHVPVTPNRGQILVTERLAPFLSYPTNKARQTDEGTVQLGSSEEDVGFDDRTTGAVVRALAERGVATFPHLSGARLVRAWGALRVMTPDGFPLYQESASCPGAFVVTCHSGITLAAAHAGKVARWILGREQPPGIECFSGDRFKNQTEDTHVHG